MDAAVLQILLAVLENGDLLGARKVRGLHAALVGGCDIRHQHGAVAADLAAAGQTPAGFIFLVGDMAGGDGVHLALNKLHAAFAAGAVAGAGGVNGHIGTAGQLQQVITGVAFDYNGASALNLEGYFHVVKFLSDFYCRAGVHPRRTHRRREQAPALRFVNWEVSRREGQCPSLFVPLRQYQTGLATNGVTVSSAPKSRHCQRRLAAYIRGSRPRTG